MLVVIALASLLLTGIITTPLQASTCEIAGFTQTTPPSHHRNSQTSPLASSTAPSRTSAPKSTNFADKRPFQRTYFAYTRKLGEGTFRDLFFNLGAFAALGVSDLWISPVHAQTIAKMDYVTADGKPASTINDHYYWTLSPGSVASELGGDLDLRALILAAKAYGIRICLDTVLDHIGYSDRMVMTYVRDDGSMVNKDIPVNDEDYFRQSYNPRRLQELYNGIDNARDWQTAIQLLGELSRTKWDEKLPTFNHDNPEIYEWLFYSYKQFVDAGIRTFRLDAFKHIPLEFLVKMVNGLTAYAKSKYGEPIAFLAEHLTFPSTEDGMPGYNYIPIDAVVAYFNEHAPLADVYFIDFPKAEETRKLAFRHDYGFSEYAKFINYRENIHNKFNIDRLVGESENHDFLVPVDHPFNRKVVYAVSDFFSQISTILFHGAERLDRNGIARTHIPSVDADGVVGKMTQIFNEHLEPLRTSKHHPKTIFHLADYHHLVAEKRDDQYSLFLVINRNETVKEFTVKLDDSILRQNVIEVVFDDHTEGPKPLEAIYILDTHEVKLTIHPKTVALVKVHNLAR